MQASTVVLAFLFFALNDATCSDTDDYAKDSNSMGCSWYNYHSASCGKFDDDNFRADQMCCACGGGDAPSGGGSGSCSAQVQDEFLWTVLLNSDCQRALLNGLPDPCRLDACPCWNSVSQEIGQSYLECQMPGISNVFTLDTAFAHCNYNAGMTPNGLCPTLPSCSASQEKEIIEMFNKPATCNAFDDSNVVDPTWDERCECLLSFEPHEVTVLRSFECKPAGPYMYGHYSFGETYDACSSARAASLFFLLFIALSII